MTATARSKSGKSGKSSPSRRFGIAVGVDGSPSSAVAVRWAARDAELRNVALTLAHVMTGTAPWPISMLARALGRPPTGRARRIIDEALAVVHDSCRAGGPAKVITRVARVSRVSRVSRADAAAALVDLSANAELLVVGARGTGGVRRALYGSVSSEVVRRSHCAVAVIHDEDPLMPHPGQAPVLVGVGGGHGSARAESLARQEAERRGVALIEVPVSQAADRLVEQSESAQLVVVGDPVAGAAIARSARMPVIIAR